MNAAVATAPIAATAAATTATVAAADDMSASAAAVVVGRLLGTVATVVEAVATADLLPPPRTCLHLPRFTEQCHREGSQQPARATEWVSMQRPSISIRLGTSAKSTVYVSARASAVSSCPAAALELQRIL